MKDHTQTSREFLERAMATLPAGHDLENARHHIQKALVEIQQASSKKAKKKSQQEQSVHERWVFDMKKGLVNPFNAKNALSVIEQMIQDEQDKIDSLKAKPNDGDNDENVGTILD